MNIQNITKYKARLVTKGFAQREGVDYNKTYLSVAKLITVRHFLLYRQIITCMYIKWM